ncbi:MAG: ABC transporter ATP-binding protein [Candidatus Schekmanbacteria bacterium]|nr:ABC transporter ATP-binding protein [Candidatus Schekmanbacteria bacterium]
MRSERGLLALSVAAAGLANALLFAAPLIPAAMIDVVLQSKPPVGPTRWLVSMLGGAPALRAHVWLAGAAVVLITTLAWAVTYAGRRAAVLASERVAKKLRVRLYDHIQRMSCAVHDRTDTGDLVQRCTSDVDTVRLFLGEQLGHAITVAIMTAIAVPMMLAVDPSMAIVAITLIPLVLIFSAVFYGRVLVTSERAEQAESRLTARLHENLVGVRVVRAFFRQEHESSQFAGLATAYRDAQLASGRVLSRYWAFSDLTTFSGEGLILIFGAYRVADGNLDVGSLFVFLSYAQMLFWPIRMLGRLLTRMGKAMVSFGRIDSVLQEPLEECRQDSPDGTNIRHQRRRGCSVEFENVTFSYHADGDRTVLRGVSFAVAPGETLAILGPSGSGKTSIVALLLRLYDLTSGTIRVDGVDIRRLGRAEVRQKFGTVLQEPFLYSRSIRDNIVMGKATADPAAIFEAARMACLEDAVNGFRHGFDTVVGERGVTLSGGQRQRLALARALLRDPDVLILDDALCAVDAETEHSIMTALAARRHRGTTIVIAHRLSTLRHADRFLVLEGGQVTQLGSHEELLPTAGLYRRLWELQEAGLARTGAGTR